MTTAPVDHIHISEREPDGSWEDCTWDSGLEWYRLVYDERVPATHAEAQALRAASGEPPTGGSNIGNLRDGIRRRYGDIVAQPLRSFSELADALTNNRVAVVQGSMAAFGPDHPLSKWDRNFNSAHAIVLINYGGRLLWCDPEAPTNADVPVEVTWTEVKRFVAALPGAQHLVGPIRHTAQEATVGVSFTPTKAERGTFTFSVDANLIDTSTGKFTPVKRGFVRLTSAIVTIVDGPYTGKAAYLCSLDKRSVLALVAHGTYVPVPVPQFTQADIDAAIKADRAKARVTYA